MIDAPEAAKWISVKDRLPDGQYPVLVYVPPYTDRNEEYRGYVGMAYHTSFGEGFWAGTDGNVYGAIGIIRNPTHWMPLPEKPRWTIKGRRMTDAESIGMLFDDPPDVPYDAFVVKQHGEE